MTNEELPQSVEQASAYLDGELEATERAAAAADAEVMAAVESLTRVRSALAQVDPVSASTKDTAILAALAEFDTLHGSSAAAATAPAKVTSLQSRRMRTYRVLTGVAAAAIIGVVAVAALNSSGNGSSDQSSAGSLALDAAELPTTKIAAADTASPTAGTDAAATGGAFNAAGSAEAAADTLPVIDSRQALVDFAASRELQATTAATAAPAPAAPAGTTAAAADTIPAASPTESDSADAAACLSPDQSVLGAIFYQGTPALAVRNTTTGALQAIADTDCHVLEEVIP